MWKIAIFTCLVCFLHLGATVEVNTCNNGEKGLDAIQQEIKIGRCKKAPCRLRKGTVIPAEFKFTPSFDTPTLINRVTAKIVGIPFPFIGVDGTDACKTIYKEDGKTLAGCPLKKGETYMFKNQFDVLSIYPTIKLEVHWGLEGNSGAHVVCFEVPARITN
ncbi:NPC intracellular cholesterol transporter 2 [Coccinella septempunctata]|uniref:NPC intracellular cholesterol transporter 2 n=1 Tax=Coccinella septempunctata TaxID=41139 RepID=UPI001D05DC78|nr:NPC intracellular cholesterol transporter 2 [Coccinella septempunctata]